MAEKSYTAVVQEVTTGDHGKYAVARSEHPELHGGSITFSLESPIWTEKADPEPGSVVLLSDVRKKAAGWRAYSAKFVRP